MERLLDSVQFRCCMRAILLGTILIHLGVYINDLFHVYSATQQLSERTDVLSGDGAEYLFGSLFIGLGSFSVTIVTVLCVVGSVLALLSLILYIVIFRVSGVVLRHILYLIPCVLYLLSCTVLCAMTGDAVFMFVFVVHVILSVIE